MRRGRAGALDSRAAAPIGSGQAGIAALSQDTIVHRVVRPAVRAIAPTGVRPNHLTTLRLITGLAAAAAFAEGSRTWLVLGGAIFLLSFLLDRADGELARQTGQSSRAGHVYDLISDCTSSVAAFIGLGIGLVPALGWAAPLLGVLAGAGIGALFWQLNVLRLAKVRGHTLFGGRITVDPDDAMVFVPLLIWLGAALPMLVAAAAITPLAALWIGWSGRQARGR